MPWIIVLFAVFRLFSADFDCAFVGTSPVPLFEALYRHHCGQKVLILEAAAECGGAWKSVDLCGVSHADMGCHEISSFLELNSFLEQYGGCRITASDRNYYFSKGCFELVGNLVKRIRAAGVALMTSCRVESAYLDIEKNEAVLKTEKGNFTASKVVVTPGSSFTIEGSACSTVGKPHKFYHLYLLLQDPTPPRFTYHSGISSGISRMMNLTSFVELENTGRQLIVLQTYSEQQFQNSHSILEDLQKAQMVSTGAYLLQSESYIYEQGPHFQLGQLRPAEQAFFEMLNTSHFNVINNYARTWKEKLPPYQEGAP